jgi:hypothetical protein
MQRQEAVNLKEIGRLSLPVLHSFLHSTIKNLIGGAHEYKFGVKRGSGYILLRNRGEHKLDYAMNHIFS